MHWVLVKHTDCVYWECLWYWSCIQIIGIGKYNKVFLYVNIRITSPLRICST